MHALHSTYYTYVFTFMMYNLNILNSCSTIKLNKLIVFIIDGADWPATISNIFIVQILIIFFILFFCCCSKWMGYLRSSISNRTIIHYHWNWVTSLDFVWAHEWKIIRVHNCGNKTNIHNEQQKSWTTFQMLILWIKHIPIKYFRNLMFRSHVPTFSDICLLFINCLLHVY